MIKKHRKNWALFILICLFLAMFSTYAYAANVISMEKTIVVEDARQYSNSREARVIGKPRGRFISSVEITMTDKGGGTIGIYSDILCHEAMKEIRMWLTLEKWIPEEEVWESVRTDQFSWKAVDFPNEDLTMAIATYDISRLERGQDYRVSGLFGADAFTPGLGESWSINTPDFFLE